MSGSTVWSYPNGGTITDTAGSNVIEIGTGAATVNAGNGTDTIQGGTGPLTVFGTGDINNIDVQGGAGALTVDLLAATGNATISGGTGAEDITAGAGSLLVDQAAPLTLYFGSGTISVVADGNPIDLWYLPSGGGGGYVQLSTSPGETLTVSPDTNSGYVDVTNGSSTVAVLNGFDWAPNFADAESDNPSDAANLAGAVMTSAAGRVSVVAGIAVPSSFLQTTTIDVFRVSNTGSYNSFESAINNGSIYDTFGTPTVGSTVAPGVTLVGMVTADANGNWSWTPTFAAGGKYELTVATDEYGDLSAPSPLETFYGPSALTAPAPILDPGSDSGTPGDDITDVARPTIDVAAPVGETVTLVDVSTGTTFAVSSTAVTSGTIEWKFTPASTLAAGPHTLVATATTSTDFNAGTVEVTIVAAPTVSAALDPASYTAANGSTLATDHTAPTIDISTGIAGGTVTLTANGSVVASGTADANGSIAFTPTLTIGAHALTATVTDSYGDHATSGPFDLTVYSVPNAPTVSLDHASISGTVTYATDIGTPRIDVGTDADAASVTLSANGTVAFTGTEVSAGSWAFTPTTSLAAGTYDLTARVTDPYGDVTTGTFDLTVAPAPTAPTLALALSNQSPDFATDTDHTAPTIDISTGIAGGTVTLTANGSVVASGTADANGSIALAPTLAIGAHALTATITDSYGDHASSTPLDLTVYAVPKAPTLRLAPASITGTSPDLTDVAAPTIDITTDADTAGVTLSANGTIAFTGTEVSAGSWVFTPAASLAIGTYDLTATATDPYGNVTTGTFDLTVVTPPAAPTLALDPDSYTEPNGGTIATANTSPTIDISTGVAGESVTLTANGSIVASGTADGNGNIQFAPTLTLGTHDLAATVTDRYGDHATSTPLDLSVYAVPNAPTLSLAHASI